MANIEEIKAKYCADKSLLEMSRSNDPNFKKYANEKTTKVAMNRMMGKNLNTSLKGKMLDYMQKEAKNALGLLNGVKTRADVDLKAYAKNPAIVKAAENAISSCKTLLSLIEQNQRATT